jgi:hypothetical protein
MSSILELYNKKVPTTGKANTKGIDKTPIGIEDPFDPSKDLINTNLDKPRKGPLGSGSGGYDNVKRYSDSIRQK